MNKESTFSSRLKRILGPRKRNPWAISLGLSSNMITRMSNNEIPGWEALWAIMLKENVSPAWLIEGKGSPYLVSVYSAEDDLVDHLRARLDDKQWCLDQECHVVTDGRFIGYVFVKPSHYDYKGRIVDYVSLEANVGIMGVETRQLCHNLIDCCHLYVTEFNAEQMRLIRLGQLGSFHLFGDSKHRGLLNTGPVIKYAEDLPKILHSSHLVNDKIAQEQAQLINHDWLIKILTLLDTLIVTHEITLTTEQKSKAIAALYRQAQRSKDVEQVLNKHQVLAILEVMSC